MKKTRAVLIINQVVDPVSIVPARCGAGAAASVGAGNVSISVVAAVSVTAGEAASVDESCAFEIPSGASDMNITARTDANAIQTLGQNFLLIACRLFLAW